MKKQLFLLYLFLLLSWNNYSQNTALGYEETLIGIDSLDIVPKINLDSINFSASSEMLDEDSYWTIVENSIKATSSQEDQELFLISAIEKLSPKEMVGFRLRTDKLLFDSYTSDLWCADYIISNGCTDDGFEYFRCWLISRGREAYYKTKENPNYLVNLVGEEPQIYDFESFWYVAMNAFRNMTNQDIYAYIDYDNFKTNDLNYPLLEFNWNIDEPKTMEKVCPVLFKKFWKK